MRNQPATNGTRVSVPTAAFKQGDFSQFRDAAGNLIPIFDPATTTPNGARTAFPGNIIPANRFSSVARNVLPLIPEPDYPFTPIVFWGFNPVNGVGIRGSYDWVIGRLC